MPGSIRSSRTRSGREGTAPRRASSPARRRRRRSCPACSRRLPSPFGCSGRRPRSGWLARPGAEGPRSLLIGDGRFGPCVRHEVVGRERSRRSVLPRPGSLSTGQPPADAPRPGAADGQAEPVPLVRSGSGLRELRELVEDPLELVGRDAGRRCRGRPRRSQPSGRRPARDRHLAASVNLTALPTRFTIIRPELHPVGRGAPGRAGRPTTRTRGPWSGPRSRAGRGWTRAIRRGEFAGMMVDLAGVEPGEVEQVVDQLDQVRGHRADVAGPGAASSSPGRPRISTTGQQQLGLEAQGVDRACRRSWLTADRNWRLAARGLLGRLHRRLQLGLGALALGHVHDQGQRPAGLARVGAAGARTASRGTASSRAGRSRARGPGSLVTCET